jgi:hypothetical protein
MRVILVLLAIAFALSGPVASGARFGKIRTAQSYCAICGNDRVACITRCNGSGTCIQNCDDDYRLCIERACRH